MHLVTGCCGVIGTQLVRRLLRDGHSVAGVDLQQHGLDYPYARADVANYRQLECAFNQFRPTMVWHLAAEFGRVNGESFYEQMWTTNVIGTRNVIELCLAHNVPLVFASSSEVYGDLSVPEMSEEMVLDRWIEHLNDYASSKYVNEMQIMRAAKQRGLKAMTLRLFCIYGPGEIYTPYRSVICRFCWQCLHGLPVTVYAQHKRCFLYIDDLLDTLARIPVRFKPGATLNIGGTEPVDMRTLWSMVSAAAGEHYRPGPITVTDQECWNVLSKKADIRAVCELLDHNPIVSLDDGLRRTICWMRSL